MKDKELLSEFMNLMLKFKKDELYKINKCENLTKSEMVTLFVLRDIMNENNKNEVLLSELRQRLKLAPSTITPVITSLESLGLIQRVIYKDDRRNIYIKVSKKGEKYTDKIDKNMSENLSQYIDFMGIDDTKELIRLFSKTISYLEERKKKYEENI